jgi:hypothetical protein
VTETHQVARGSNFLSRRLREELYGLEANVRSLSASRGAALRLFVASRHAASMLAQREFWFEFVWTHQEYRAAVRRLAQFCSDHREATRR